MMDGRIEESMTSTMEVKITDKKSKSILLQDCGRNAGLEVAGDIRQIITG
jgi:tocopherol cyclase